MDTSENVEPKPVFNDLLDTSGAKQISASLRAAIRAGYLDHSRIHRIADFGAGIGQSIFGIKKVFNAPNIEIDALEKTPLFITLLKQAAIVSPDHIISGDGIEYLRLLPQRGDAKYDLITAFRLGHDSMGRIFRELANASANALNPNGYLIITSDDISLSRAIEACKEVKAKYYIINEVNDGNDTVVPTTLVVPHSACSKIKPLDISNSLI